MRYYFICSLFPKLSLDNSPDLSFNELDKILDWNLKKEDKEKVKILRMYIDFKNIERLKEKKPLDPHGNLDEKELDEAILTKSFFPSEIFDKDKNFLSCFINYYMKAKNSFLSYFYKTEREIKIISTVLRAKEEDRDIEKELFFEDKKDPFVFMMISQKGKEIEVPREYEKLVENFKKNKNDPQKLHFEYLKWRFQLNQKIAGKDSFSIDYILGYIANLFIVEDFYKLDKNKGKMFLESYLG